MSQPQRLVVTYDDGSTQEVAFSRVDADLRLRLAGLGLCPPTERVGASPRYLLIRWQDGWQEVVGLDFDTADLLRYYVIRRIEDRGRLSLDVGTEYPELLIVERTPRDVIGAAIIGDDKVDSYTLGAEVERWEGIFDDGGKLEFVKYDRTSDTYPHESSADPDEALSELLASLGARLKERRLTPQALLSMDEPLRMAEYKELAAGTGIRGASKQEDVYGFVEMLLRRLEGVDE